LISLGVVLAEVAELSNPGALGIAKTTVSDIASCARAAAVNWALAQTLSDDELQARLHPDGHFKFPHLWPVKFPQAGRLNYQLFSLSGSGFLSW